MARTLTLHESRSLARLIHEDQALPEFIGRCPAVDISSFAAWVRAAYKDFTGAEQRQRRARTVSCSSSSRPRCWPEAHQGADQVCTEDAPW